jgi:hypothetical protein
VRSTGSLNSRIGLMLMAHHPFGGPPDAAAGPGRFVRLRPDQV